MAAGLGWPPLPHPRAPGRRPLLTTGHRLLGYVGYSEGGIEGAALAALAQDFTRAVLGVPGMEYSLLLNRSVDFTPFQQLLDVSYPDKLEQQILLGLLQMLWDRGEGDGYADHLTSDPLPGTPVKRVLMHEAFGDHQVANVSTELMARTLGVHIYQPALRPHRSLDVVPFWGIPAIPRIPFPGSALVVWDSGSPPAPAHIGEAHTAACARPVARPHCGELVQMGCSGGPLVASAGLASPCAVNRGLTARSTRMAGLPPPGRGCPGSCWGQRLARRLGGGGAGGTVAARPLR